MKGFLDEKKIEKKYGKRKHIKLVVLPTFNELFGGTSVKNSAENMLLGPIFRNKIVDIEECEAYLLDGTFLGKVKEI